LLRIWEQSQKTIVFVTHDLTEALTLADRVVVLTPHPGTVKAEVKVALARPRDSLSVPFVDCQKTVVGHLR